MKGQYTQATVDRVTVARPAKITLLEESYSWQHWPASQKGLYVRGNVKTRTGAEVYEWMGWEGEVIAR